MPRFMKAAGNLLLTLNKNRLDSSEKSKVLLRLTKK
jgi:hypothetical protein